MWTKIWHSIGQFFEYIFDFLPLIGNKINYIYILIITAFLILWSFKMVQDEKKHNN